MKLCPARRIIVVSATGNLPAAVKKNPYGNRLEEVLGSHSTYEEDILSIQNEDPDSDGYSSRSEIEDLIPYTNPPTFPGLTPANVGNVSRVDVIEIQDHLVPSSGGETTPPDVTVNTPNGGETFTANAAASIQWSASAASGVSGINLYVSLDNGGFYSILAQGLTNTWKLYLVSGQPSRH